MKVSLYGKEDQVLYLRLKRTDGPISLLAVLVAVAFSG
jgi:hypothetical protein